MTTYAYDFQTCGFETIDNVRAIIESQPNWDRSSNIKQAKANNAAAANRFGFKQLLTAEQKALAKFLVDKLAGLHIATYAWGIYADLQSNEKSSVAKSYGLTPA